LALALGSGCSRGSATVRVAFLDFENSTGSDQYGFLETALPEYLITELSQSPAAAMLDRHNPRLARDPQLVEENAASRRWLAANLGQADYYIAGGVSRLERNFILTARLCDARSGRVVPGSAITQTCIHEFEIYSRAQNIAVFLAEKLRLNGIETPLAQGLAGVEAPPPSSDLLE
jgi:TolB-like protein